MCELYNDQCRYDKPPPMSQLVAMAKRLQEAEQTVAEMRAGAISSPQVMLPHADVPSLLPPHAPSLSENSRAPLDRLSPSLSPFGTGESSTTNNQTWNDETTVSTRVDHNAPKQSGSAELSVDEHGTIPYYGPTSAVHEPSQVDLLESHPRDVPSVDTSSSLSAFVRESEIWEEFAIGNASLQTHIPRQVIAKLLHIHWTWVGPMFLYVHRSAFIRTSCKAIS